jgi:hypothetical protein
LQSLLLKIDLTEIVVHKADQPNTVVDLFDAHGLTRERSAEIDFLFENADPSAIGNQSCPIVERIGEFSDASIWPRGRLIDFDGALHIESLMRALVLTEREQFLAHLLRQGMLQQMCEKLWTLPPTVATLGA